MTQELLQEKWNRLKCCVVIPTYNNHGTLRKLIEDVLEYTDNIIIVNDGSTDTTPTILKEFSSLTQIHLEENSGKGFALRRGFEEALKMGYEYAITIDSDGQHFPEDLIIFIEELEKADSKEILLIGDRNMGQDGIPKKSSFGNRFSNFWFWVETGVRLQDTQSGYRLYPLLAIKDLKLTTTKFEFEIEVIVKASWSGVEVRNVPVQVHYDVEDRVSHFRPFKDFTRISILNTYLVFLTFFYIKPRNIYRKIKENGIRKFMIEDLLKSNEPIEKKSLAIALGVFVGLTPLWGFHTAIVLFLAILFRLNKVIAFAFSNVSIPPFIPFIIYYSVKMGNWILGEDLVMSFDKLDLEIDVVKHLKVYIVGAFSLATIAALLIGALSFILLKFFGRKGGVKHG